MIAVVVPTIRPEQYSKFILAWCDLFLLAPFMYQAPMFDDINRFADIWSGIEVKKVIDKNNWCAVSGYSTILHKRASNPFVNLIKEAKGVKMNEEYGKDEYFKLYEEKRKRWEKAINEIL